MCPIPQGTSYMKFRSGIWWCINLIVKTSRTWNLIHDCFLVHCIISLLDEVINPGTLLANVNTNWQQVGNICFLRFMFDLIFNFLNFSAIRLNWVLCNNELLKLNVGFGFQCQNVFPATICFCFFFWMADTLQLLLYECQRSEYLLKSYLW